MLSTKTLSQDGPSSRPRGRSRRATTRACPPMASAVSPPNSTYASTAFAALRKAPDAVACTSGHAARPSANTTPKRTSAPAGPLAIRARYLGGRDRIRFPLGSACGGRPAREREQRKQDERERQQLFVHPPEVVGPVRAHEVQACHACQVRDVERDETRDEADQLDPDARGKSQHGRGEQRLRVER